MLEIPASCKFTLDNNTICNQPYHTSRLYGLVCAMSYPLIGGSELCDKRFKLNFSVHGPEYLATFVKIYNFGREG